MFNILSCLLYWLLTKPFRSLRTVTYSWCSRAVLTCKSVVQLPPSPPKPWLARRSSWCHNGPGQGVGGEHVTCVLSLRLDNRLMLSAHLSDGQMSLPSSSSCPPHLLGRDSPVPGPSRHHSYLPPQNWEWTSVQAPVLPPSALGRALPLSNVAGMLLAMLKVTVIFSPETFHTNLVSIPSTSSSQAPDILGRDLCF